MPLTITKLKMWKNPGYTRECVEVPPCGSWKMPAPDYTSSENLRPRKGSTLTAVELPLPYLQIMNMSYLYIEVQDGVTPTPNTMKLFGWIVSIEETASSNESVKITWNVDYWRTYSGSAVLGSGTIKRSSDDTHARPSTYRPRRWIVSDSYSLAFDEDGMDMDLWVYVLMVGTSGTDTFYTLLTSPLIFNHFATGYDAGGEITTVSDMVDLYDIYNGFLDEFINNSNWTLDSNNVIGVWVGNVCPFSGVYTETYGGQRVWRVDDLSWTSLNRGWVGDANGTGLYPKRMLYSRVYFNDAIQGIKGNKRTFTTPLKADDKHRYIFVDPFGNNIGEVPWGTSFTSAELSVDIGPSGAYGFITLESDGVSIASTYDKERNAQSAGVRFSYALPPVALTENYYSSYIISGQRDAARENMRISRERGYETRLLGIGTSTAQGAAMGTFAGSPMTGAVIGAGTGLTGAIGGKFIDEKFDDKLLDVQDMLAAKHSNGIALFGDGAIWLTWCDSGGNRAYQASPYMIELTMNSADEDEYDDMISLNGYETFEPFDSSLNLTSYTGALRIEQLTITGSIPPEAKSAIKTKLENGVRIVENNPTGVNP